LSDYLKRLVVAGFSLRQKVTHWVRTEKPKPSHPEGCGYISKKYRSIQVEAD